MSEMADGRGWDRGDTPLLPRPPLRTIGTALNTTIKAMHMNEHVDAFDLLYALLIDRTIVIVLFFEAVAIDSVLYEGLVSMGYSGVPTSGWTDGFERLVAELTAQRHCALALDPCVLFLTRSSHVEDLLVGPSYWTDNDMIGTNYVSFNHNNNGMDCPFCDRREQRARGRSQCLG